MFTGEIQRFQTGQKTFPYSIMSKTFCPTVVPLVVYSKPVCCLGMLGNLTFPSLAYPLPAPFGSRSGSTAAPVQEHVWVKGILGDVFSSSRGRCHVLQTGGFLYAQYTAPAPAPGVSESKALQGRYRRRDEWDCPAPQSWPVTPLHWTKMSKCCSYVLML